MGSVQDDQVSVKSEDLPAPRVKFLGSHGGKILPRPQDGQLRYVGGETRMVAINRNISYTELTTKLAKLFGPNLMLKYQLPNEDLDALISVTSDEDVENMMEEHDRIDALEGASRLRAFLFPVKSSFGSLGSDFLDEPKGPEQKYVDALNGVHTPPKAQVEASSPSPFQLPDYLFGLDTAAHQQHQEREIFSPTYPEVSLVPPIPSTLTEPSLVLPKVVLSHVDQSRQQTCVMDTGVGNPALATAAVGPLISKPPVDQMMWETKKGWDGRVAGDQKGEQRDELMEEAKKDWDGGMIRDQRGEQRDEKRLGDVNGDANYSRLQKNIDTEASVPRVASKDRIIPQILDGSSPELHLVQGKHQPKQPMQSAGATHKEKKKPDQFPSDVPAILTDMMQENAAGGGGGSGGRFQRAAEIQRGTSQASLGAVEMQKGAPHPNLGAIQGFDPVTERPQDGRRNSGESDQEMPKRLEAQVVVESVISRPISTSTSEGQADLFKYEDAHEVYIGEDIVQQQQQQQKQEDLDMPPSHFAQQLDAARHMHPVVKGHIQQVYWQPWDPQEQQQEPTRVHSAPSFQRVVTPPSTQLPTLGAAAPHLHRVPSAPNNMRTTPQGIDMRTIPRADALANTRTPSSLYKQAGTTVTIQSDMQQLPRAVSPLHDDHPYAAVPPLPYRYGARVVQTREGRVITPTTNQQFSGLPVPPYLDPADPHLIYEHSGVKYPEMVIKGNYDMPPGPVHYQGKP